MTYAEALKKLKGKRALFVQEYMLDLNGAGAYKRAGYRAKNDHGAAVEAGRLLTNPDIAKAVEVGKAERSKRVEIDADMVLGGLLREAKREGTGSSHSARVQAWGLLGRHLGIMEGESGERVQTVNQYVIPRNLTPEAARLMLEDLRKQGKLPGQVKQ